MNKKSNLILTESTHAMPNGIVLTRFTIREDERATFADLQSSEHCSRDFGVTGAELRAHALRFMASQDLLDALIELASGHSMAGEEMARAAIAKATGDGQ